MAFLQQIHTTSIVQPCKPSWKAGKPSLQTLFSDKKGRMRHEKANVCTPRTFNDSEGTYDDDDDDDEMIEESVVISIDDADEYIALFHQVERGLTC